MLDKICLSLLEQCPASHWAVDADGVLVSIFGPCEAFFGKPAEELLGRRLKEALAPELARAWCERVGRVFRGEVLTLRDRPRDSAWNISVFPIRMDGEIRYAGGLARESTAWTKSEQDLRSTVLGALKAQEFDRSNVSRFLHDTVGQNLTALGLQLDLIRMDFEGLSTEVGGRIVESQKLLEQIMEEVRDYSYELNPSAVERTGLRSALDRLVARVRGRFPGTIRLNIDPSVKLEKTVAQAMYQIAKEAVDNATQHSCCSAIEIAVKSSRAGGFLEVRDNGHGFDPADVSRGYRGLGLLSMEQHAAQAGLGLSVVSTREAGTVVRADLSEAG
jgi:signal transduction histidine kinase